MSPDNEFFAQFRDSVERAWAKKLVSEFFKQKGEVFRHLNKDLNVPNFAFSFDTTKMGSWDRETKTIMISYQLLRNYTWEDVVQTLKHEMAHMIVTEVWGDIDANGHKHGELFAKACQIMGVPVSTRLLPGYNMEQKEKLVARVHKLFALGESNHKEEAATAVNKAYELMARHNISALDLPTENRKFVFRPVGEIYGRVPLYVKMLARLVSKHYFVQHILMSYGVNRGQGWRREISRYVEIFGEPHNVDVAEYVYHFLLSEGDRQWEDFQKSSAFHKGCHTRGAFLEGFYSGFAQTLRKEQDHVMEEVSPGNTLPIGLDDPLLDEKFRSHYRPRNMASSCGSRGAGRDAGSARGASVRIRPGISKGGPSTKLLT